MKTTPLLVALAWLCVPRAVQATEPARGPAFGNSRELPSLEIAWRHDGRKVVQVLVEDGVVYAVGYRWLAAYDAASGERLWQRAFADVLHFARHGALLSGERIAAVFGPEVYLLDAASGTPIGTYRLPEQSHNVELAGPPLLVAAPERDEEGKIRIHRLVRLDDAGAVPIAERVFEADLFQWWVVGGLPVVKLTRFDDNESTSTLIGLDAGTLDVRWQTPAEYGEIREIQGRHYFELPEGETVRLQAFDPSTGALDRQGLEVAAQTDFFRFADELVTAGVHEEPHLLRRIDPLTGTALWTLALPAPAGAHVHIGDRLFVDCRQAAGGRGLLAEVGWKDGELRRLAYGLKGVRSLAAWGDLLFAGTPDGLVAFRNDRFGPPEAATRAVSDEVRRILGEIERHAFPSHEAAGELAALGPEALQLLAEVAGELGPAQLQAAALVLGEAGYRPAGAVLARRLAAIARLRQPDRGSWVWLKAALLGALATTGGPAEVEIVGPLLLDTGETDAHAALSIRRQAHFTLAAIGTPEALDFLDRARKHPAAGLWWRVPDPAAALEILGREIGSAELDAARDAETHNRLYLHRLIQLVESQGRRLLVFPSPFLNSTDLWAAELDDDGRPGTPDFLGTAFVQLAGAYHPDGLQATLEGETLLLRATTGEGRAARIDLRAARLDQDGDGLPDLVERRLGLDPESADTDGDGLSDAQDRAPDARYPEPKGDEEQILAAVFEAYFELYAPRDRVGLAVVRDAPALEWRGRSGPTVTFDEGEVAALADAGLFDGILKIQIEPAGDAPELAKRRARMRDGERLYVVTTSRGPLGGQGDTALVRQIGSSWVVCWIEPWWIS